MRERRTLPSSRLQAVLTRALLVVPLLVLATARRYAARHDHILATGVAGPDRRVLATTAVAMALGVAALAVILVG